MKTIKQILALIIINNFFIIQTTIADNVETLEPIIVTGSLIPTKLKQTGAAVTVITSKEIEESKANNLSEILTGSAGFQVYESGGPYSLSRAFLRGNETDHTLVLINGMKIVDPATGRGSVDLERITLSSVERIEVIRGSQSALYGSEAIGGVINVILKRGGDKYKKYINLSARKISYMQKITQWKKKGVVNFDGTELKGNLKAALILPDGKPNTPTFLVFHNFTKILQWNRSLRFGVSVCTLAEMIKI